MTDTTPRPVLYLIDGHALAYRQYFASLHVHSRTGALQTAAGEPTGAVHFFTNKLFEILEKDNPEYLAVTFDTGLSGREILYPEYKSNRAEMPEDLAKQIIRIRQVVEAFNIPILELEGHEADDVMGTISLQAEVMGVDIQIITGDRDILQLLSPYTSVRLQARQGDKEDPIFDEAAFRAKYQLEPSQLVDLKALMGDTSDNIPGVKGIGEKTATTLLTEHKTLDQIYANIEQIKGATKQKLLDGRDSAYLSQNLATIRRDLPVILELEKCVAHDFQEATVDNIFAELEFRTLRTRLPKIKQRRAQQIAEVTEGEAHDPMEYVNTIVVNTPELLAHLVNDLNNAPAIVWDVESTSVDQMSADLVGIAFSTDGKTGYYVPVGHKEESMGELFPADALPDQLPIATVMDAIRPAMTNPAIPKIAHNASYDLVVFRRYGVDVAPIAFDTMIAEWVNDPASNNLGLKKLVPDRFIVNQMMPIEKLLKPEGRKKARTMAQVPIELAAPYAAADAVYTYQLWLDNPTIPLRAFTKENLECKPLIVGLREKNQSDLFEKLEMPLVPVIAAMEQHGALINVPYLEGMSSDLQGELTQLEEKIYGLCGERFNLNSPKQVSDMLFEKLKLPTHKLKKTSQGFLSTDVNTLEALKDEHEVIPIFMEYRELSKLKSTYVDALPELVNRKTGRVHTSYNQAGSATGRFSSNNPNLQNIPILTERGRQVRKAFIADEGKVLLAVDYSQIELRVMAHISEDPTLLEAFRQGQDIHRATAAAVNNVEPDDVTYEQRSFAKRVNFGLMYGMGAFRLARDSELALAEAERFIEAYFARFPRVREYINRTETQAQNDGYVTTLLGRRRYFHDLAAKSAQAKAAELRAAINMPIQGTAADILKIAILRLDEALRQQQSRAKLILQVHDELVLEVPDDDLQATARLVVDIMEGAYELKAPLVANPAYGKNWLDMETVRL
jgi:DNA polymerase I